MKDQNLMKSPASASTVSNCTTENERATTKPAEATNFTTEASAPYPRDTRFKGRKRVSVGGNEEECKQGCCETTIKKRNLETHSRAAKSPITDMVCSEKSNASKTEKQDVGLLSINPLSETTIKKEKEDVEMFCISSLSECNTGVGSDVDEADKRCSNDTVCAVCFLDCHTSADLKKHLRVHTGEKPYECDLCNLAFSRASDLARHRRVHTGERPFTCLSCGRKFSRQDNLKQHARRHNELDGHKSYGSGPAGRIQLDAGKLQRPRGIPRIKTENERATTKPAEATNFTTEASAPYPRDTRFKGRKRVSVGGNEEECKQGCCETTIKKRNLETHSRAAKSPITDMVCSEKSNASKTEKQDVGLLSINPLSETTIKKEKEDVEMFCISSLSECNTGVGCDVDEADKRCSNDTVCAVCFLDCHTSADLKKHLRVHTGEKPYECDLCNLAFSRASDLARHRRVHTGERPFTCLSCGRKFSRQDYLKQHARRHNELDGHKSYGTGPAGRIQLDAGKLQRPRGIPRIKTENERATTKPAEATNFTTEASAPYPRDTRFKGRKRVSVGGNEEECKQGCCETTIKKRNLETHSRAAKSPITDMVCSEKSNASKTEKQDVGLLSINPLSETTIKKEKEDVEMFCISSLSECNTGVGSDVDEADKRCSNDTVCAVCFLDCHTSADLKKLLRVHTGEKPYECDLCNLAFSRASDLARHRRVHTGERPFTCLSCGRKFSRQDNLKQHARRHNELDGHKSYGSGPAGRIQLDAGKLQRPRGIPRIKAFNQASTSGDLLARKSWKVSDGSDLDALADNDSVPSEHNHETMCALPLKLQLKHSFKESKTENERATTKPAEATNFTTEASAPYPRDTRFKGRKRVSVGGNEEECKQGCCETTIKKRNLETHSRAAKSPITDMVCSEKSNASKTEKQDVGLLSINPLSETTIKKEKEDVEMFCISSLSECNTGVGSDVDEADKRCSNDTVCAVCFLDCHTSADLKKHLRVHTGEKPYECDLCNLAFSRASDLARHRRVHTGERPFTCLSCGRKFSRQDNLKQHARRHNELDGHKSYGSGPAGRIQLDAGKLQRPRGIPRIKAFNQASTSGDLLARKSWKVSDGSDLDALADNDSVPSEHNHETMCALPLKLQLKHSFKESKVYTCAVCNQNFNCPKERRVHRNTSHGKVRESSNGESLMETEETSEKTEEKGSLICTVNVRENEHSTTNKNSSITELLNKGEETKRLSEDTGESNVEISKANATKQTCFLHAYLCSKCPEMFTSAKLRAIHESKPHQIMKDVRNICKTCNETFENHSSFREHLQIHPLECSYCDKCFTWHQNSDLHIGHLNIKLRKCTLCDNAFISKQKLAEHINTHTGNRPIKCPMCDETFRLYSDLCEHRNRHHLEKKKEFKDFICGCGEIFHSKNKLEWHKETHDINPKRCKYCTEGFVHVSSLTRPIRKAHDCRYVPEGGCTSENVECTICGCVVLKGSLKVHMQIHKEEQPFSCHECGKDFTTKWNLKIHQGTHAPKSTRPFKCNLCKKSFFRATELTSHENSHHNMRPYTCNHCGSRFTCKHNFLQHICQHEAGKTFRCTICNMTFRRSRYLKVHLRVHSGIRPFACHICGKASTTKSNHNKHVKIHHAREQVNTEG